MTGTIDVVSSRHDPGDGEVADGPARASGTWRVDLAVVVGLCALFAVLFVLLRQNPWHYDPIEYFRSAQAFETLTPFHRTLRIGLLGPVRFSQVLFGYSQAAYYAVPLLSGMLLVAATYVIGVTVTGRWGAAAAAALVGLTSPVFATVHQLWPDLPATALFTAGMAATMLLCRRYGRGTDHDDGSLAHLGFAAAGLLVGWSYLTREFTAVLFPVVLLPFWQFRTPLRYVVSGALGALGAFAGELAFGAVFHGDPLVRLRDLFVRDGSVPPPAHVIDLYEARAEQYGGVLGRLSVLPGHLVSGRTPVLAGVGALALAAPFLHRGQRRRDAVTLLAWAGLYWAVMTGLALDVDAYGRALHIEKVRYWLPLLPPLVVAGCAAAATAVRRLPTPTARRAGTWVLTVLVVGALVGELVPRLATRQNSDAFEYEQLRGWLATEGQQYDRLAATQRTRWIAELAVVSPFGTPVWQGSTQALNTARRFLDQDSVDSDVVVIDDTFFQARRSNWREVTPDWLLDLPDDWRPVFASDRGEVVVYERGAEPVDLRPLDASWVTAGAGEARVAGGQLAASLEAGQRGVLRLPVTGSAAPGTVVLTELEVATSGDGNAVPDCVLVGADGTRREVDASTLWGVGFDGPRTIQTACAVPPDLAAPVEVRLGFEVVGPLRLDAGEPRVAVVATSSAR